MQARDLIRAGIIVIAVATTAGSAGCSDQDDPRYRAHSVAAAVGTLQDAFTAADVAAVCEHMTASAQKQAGEVAHGNPRTCERDVRRAFGLIEDGGGWGESEKPVVQQVRHHGGRATARLIHEQRWAADVPLTNEGGIWKLAGFFGMDPAEFEKIEKTSRGRPFPAARQQPIEAVDHLDAACPALSDELYPVITGGCSFEVSTESVPIRMLTPFGDFKFSNCSVTYRVLVDGEGRTWIDDVTFAGRNQRGCSDIDACIGEQRYLPWKGRLTSDGKGGYLHHMNMCLRTCIGMFAGDFVMRLVRSGKGWRVEPTDQGATGFKIDGELSVTDGSVDLRDPS